MKLELFKSKNKDAADDSMVDVASDRFYDDDGYDEGDWGRADKKYTPGATYDHEMKNGKILEAASHDDVAKKFGYSPDKENHLRASATNYVHKPSGHQLSVHKDGQWELHGMGVHKSGAGSEGLHSYLKKVHYTQQHESKNPDHGKIKSMLNENGFSRGKGGVYTHESGQRVKYPLLDGTSFLALESNQIGSTVVELESIIETTNMPPHVKLKSTEPTSSWAIAASDKKNKPQKFEVHHKGQHIGHIEKYTDQIFRNHGRLADPTGRHTVRWAAHDLNGKEHTYYSLRPKSKTGAVSELLKGLQKNEVLNRPLLFGVLKEAVKFEKLDTTKCDICGGNHPEAKHVKAAFTAEAQKPKNKKLTAGSLWKGLGGKPKDGKKPVTAKDLMKMNEPYKIKEGEAEEFQGANDQLVGMTEAVLTEKHKGIHHNPINQKGSLWQQFKKKLQIEDEDPSPDELQKAELGKKTDGMDVLDELGEGLIAETKRYTHKIWTGPVMAHDKGFIKGLHKHYPNVKSGTEHVYVHTNHPAQHVADTLKHKMGISGFKPHEFQTKTHSGHKPDPVTEATSVNPSTPFHSVLHQAGYRITSSHPHVDTFHHPTKPKVGVLQGKNIGTSALSMGKKFESPDELRTHVQNYTPVTEGQKKFPKFDQGKEVRAIARERIGQPKGKQIIKLKKLKPEKYKPNFRKELE